MLVECGRAHKCVPEIGKDKRDREPVFSHFDSVDVILTSTFNWEQIAYCANGSLYLSVHEVSYSRVVTFSCMLGLFVLLTSLYVSG